jgi:hypothetical protein
MRYLLIAASLLIGQVASAGTQVSVGIALPGISIGINQPAYPQMVLVPGYPVYYEPRASFNYFFFDGLYWAFQDDNWYASSWYNGPWHYVGPEYVPVYILRVPVGYYRRPPKYFHGWNRNQPPRWGQYWGHAWENDRRDWDQWDHGYMPRPAPLPVYQRQYYGSRYPHQAAEQWSMHEQYYRYAPSDPVIHQYYQQQPWQRNHQYQQGPPPGYQQGPPPGYQQDPQYQQHYQPQYEPPPPEGDGPYGDPDAPHGGPDSKGKGHEKKTGPQGGGDDGQDDQHGQGHG